VWVIRELAILVARLVLVFALGIALGGLLTLLSGIPFVESCRWAFAAVGLFALLMAAAPGVTLGGRVGSSWAAGGGGFLWGGFAPAANAPRINPTAHLIVIGAACVSLAAFL